jgi:hypothetical protein
MLVFLSHALLVGESKPNMAARTSGRVRLWSPKLKKAGARNHFYETMREVSPGDVVFAFVDTFITTIGLVQSYCWESPKPTEFGGANNEERLEGENGLLLTPSIDHLFDRGFIGFEGNGNLIISPVAHRPSLERMGIETSQTLNVGSFSEGQKHYLEFHRDMVLLKSS